MTTDLTVSVPKCTKLVGIDTLNGIEQTLNFKQDGDRLKVAGVVIHDYPLILRFEQTKGEG